MSVSNNEQLDHGPSERAVAMARDWLVVWGCILVAFGIGIMVTANSIAILWGVGMAALGVAHFVVARYASNRIAVFFA
jgi:hypothetical protein